MLALGISSFMYDIVRENVGATVILVQWTAWFKKYRTVLATGDVIHVARPNGQDLDIIVRARAGETGIIFITNPCASDIVSPSLKIPPY